MTEKAKYAFAALPLRALADERLTRSHMAVLGIVSYFDRFSKNGAGCYATQAKIGEMAHTRSDHVSRVIKDLVTWGYIVVEQQKDRRRKQYRVIHDEKNTCTTAQVSRTDGCATAQVSTASYLYDSANKDIGLNPKDIPRSGVSLETKEDITDKSASVEKDRRTELAKLLDLAGKEQLPFESFKAYTANKLQSLSTQIDRNTKRGDLNPDYVLISLALRDAGEAVADRLQLGHLQRVYEDVAERVHGDEWDYDQAADDLLC
ncbi:MarR family transcriptional regulator [Thioalkalivibrio sp. ALJ1]|uniref:MarR family transcriptional regulator n=1 Tax=Thioalkalivibrio sp. ALJ1 TaxID=1158144 RepID=UPI00056FDCBE|nr:MarR family transcriptional regulator [Thioalkalivibrio sp. ALJ1]